MQYVNVAVNAKTTLSRETFTYLIMPDQLPYIKTGILVSVPFRSRKILGLVLSISKSSNLTTTKLKKIDRIVDTRPVLNNSQIELAKWISSYYLAPIGEVIFMMVPPVAHRLTSKNLENRNNQLANEKPQSVTYSIYDRAENRIKVYLKLIDKARLAQKNALVIFPKIDLAMDMVKEIEKKYSKNEIAILDSTLSITERYRIWLDIKSNKTKIVIGSRSAVFAPIQNLGVVIVDEPDDFGYKEEQSPRYNAVSASEEIARTSSANLVFGLLYPNSHLLHKIETNKNKIIGNIKVLDYLEKIKYLTIDMSNERGFISLTLENKIREYIENKKQVLLFVNQKGTGSVFICNDCKNTIKCSKCSLPFHSRNNGEELFCPRCNINQSAPQFCPVCRGTKLKPLGIGTKTVENAIKKIFPASSTNIIESEITNLSKNFNTADITIVTSKIFDYRVEKYDLTAIITIDNLLNLPDYSAEENVFMALIRLASITKNEFIVQTHNTESYIIENFPDLNVISKHLLHERYINKYPPYCKLIKLVYKDKSETKCQSEAEKMFKKINELVGSYELRVIIMGPSPCFIAKKRNYFYYQIILKTPLENASIKKKISLIKGLNNWSIDVDPVNLI